MQANQTDIDIAVIIKRIEEKELELQPSFQRGEVWSISKKKRLIDSILRGWRIPPIHVVRKENFEEEVLDGQQRLVSIRDFCNDRFKIDGEILPLDEKINKLHGKFFSELSEEEKRKFMRYSLTIITLLDFKAEEPAELFYRLNQPATLTSAEQRNAFISKPRNQIKDLVAFFEEIGASKELIGFSNSRLAYDEIISKYCYMLEIGTMKRKINSQDMSNKYRANEAFKENIIENTKDDLSRLINCLKNNRYGRKLSFNKATLFSWLIFINRNKIKYDIYDISNAMHQFEYIRQYVKGKNNFTLGQDLYKDILVMKEEYPYIESMILTFNQRASMGSTDAISIIYRDIILEMFICIITEDKKAIIDTFSDIYVNEQNFPRSLEKLNDYMNWGDRI